MNVSRGAWAAAFAWLGLVGGGLRARAAEAPGFPVHLTQGGALTGLATADLDGDGKPEIIAATEEGLVVLRAGGEVMPGWPISLRQKTDKMRWNATGAPAACDLDGDGRLEILIAGSDQRLQALRLDGNDFPGFPVLLDGKVRGPLACHGKGRQSQIVLVTDAGSLVLVAATGGVPKVLAKIGAGSESGVAVADLGGDGMLDYVLGGGDGTVTVVAQNGKVRPGFPYKMAFRSAGAPAIGDINDDGVADIVVGSQDFKIHAIDQNGKALAGFPVDTGYRIYGGPALADIDGDGVLDVVAGSADGKVYAVNGSGKSLPGFPAVVDGRVSAAPVVGDIDRDGRLDIVVVTDASRLVVLDSTGHPLSGFPVTLGGKPITAAALVDLDGDGVPEVVAQSPLGELHAYKAASLGTAEKALIAWSMEGHDAQHGGRFGPNPPRLKNLGFTVPKPLTTDPLKVKYEYFDLDGDPEVDTQVRWYLNGAHQKDLDNQREVPASRTKKHEVWSYSLQDGENFKAYGEKAQLTRIARAAEVRIANTPPGPPAIDLSPAQPHTNDTLTVKVTTPSADPDGDAVSYHYVWLVDGKPQKLPPSTTSIDPKRTHKGETWRAVVIPLDDEVEGQSSQAAVTVLNTPPGAPVIALVPGRVGEAAGKTAVPKPPVSARIDDVVEVRIVTPAPDDDKDPLSYAYLYWVNGTPLDLAGKQGSVPTRQLRKHDKLKVQVTAWDDEVAGGHVESELTVDNTPPPTPKIAIEPGAPRTAQDLRLSIVEQPADADGDAVSYKHQWRVDGQPATFPPVVPATQTKRGQSYELTVTPFDGEQDGVPATVKTRIENTPPTPPLAVLEDYAPDTDATVTPKIEVAAADDDGDPVVLKYRWQRDGKPAGLPETQTQLLPKDTSKGQHWSLDIVPNDGLIDGKAVRLELLIKNSPPTAPAIALGFAAPTTRDGQRVSVTTAATDRDADKLVYQYLWFREGKAQSTWPKDKAALQPGEAKKAEHWRVEVRAFDGEEAGPAVAAEFRVENILTDAPALQLLPRGLQAATPGRPHTDDDLECKLPRPAVDPDSDPVTYEFRWYRDGVAVPLAPDSRIVPARLTRKKEHWLCEVEAGDGSLMTDPVRSNELLIANSPPLAPVAAIAPANPGTDDELVCELSSPAADADLDVVRYRYRWTADGKPVALPAGTPGNHVPASLTKRGQELVCEVTPNDGEVDGPVAVAKATVRNTAPTLPAVRVTPEHPKANQGLACEVVKAATDADGDKLRYDFSWFKDGVQQTFASTSTDVPGRLVHGGDLWKCQVTPTDGQASGPFAQSADVIVSP